MECDMRPASNRVCRNESIGKTNDCGKREPQRESPPVPEQGKGNGKPTEPHIAQARNIMQFKGLRAAGNAED